MKSTNNVSDLLKAKGISSKSTSSLDSSKNATSFTKRKRLYQSSFTNDEGGNARSADGLLPPILETNRGQTGDKLGTNRRQTEDKLETNVEDDYQFTGESGDKLGTKLETVLETNRGQTGDKLETNISISCLVGLQRETIFYCYDSCKKTRSKRTEQLALMNISEALKSNISSVKKTLQRLENKGFLFRYIFKNGRGGWTIYELPDRVYQELLHFETEDKVRTNWRQTGDKLGTKLGTELETSPSSSSSLRFNTTTSGADEKTDSNAMLFPREWALIDSQVLQDLKVYFGKPQVKQLLEDKKLTASEVQESINRFAFDLIHNDKKKSIRTSELSFFMGMLRKGVPYACPSNYESPEEKLLREYTEKEEAYAQRKAQLRERLLKLEFEKWRLGLAPSDVRKCIPEILADFDIESQAVKSSLEIHFRDAVWPKLLNEKLNSIQLEVKSELPKSLAESEIEVLTAEQIRAIADAQFGPVREN